MKPSTITALLLSLYEFGDHSIMKPIYKKTKPIQSEEEKLNRLEAANLKRLNKNNKRIKKGEE